MARAVFILILLVGAGNAIAGSRPNVLLLVMEQLPAQSLNDIESGDTDLPNLQRLMAGGIRFDRAFTTHTTVQPNRASVLTSTFGHINGVREAGMDLPTHLATFPGLMKEAGYEVLEISAGQPDGLERAQHWLGELKPDSDFLLWFELSLRDPSVKTAEATAAHQLSVIDQALGHLQESLEARGLGPDTLILLTTLQGRPAEVGELPVGGTLLEPSIRIPFILNWGDRAESGGRREALVQHIDIAPTLLEVAGIRVPDEWQGQSLLPLFETDDRSFRDAVYVHAYEGLEEGARRQYGVRTHRYKLIRDYHEAEAWALYDLKKDPEELRNALNNPHYLMAREAMSLKLRVKQHRYGDSPELAQELLKSDLATNRSAD